MTLVSPVLACGAVLLVAVVGAVEETWSWSKQTGLVTSAVIATRCARSAAAVLGLAAGVAVTIAAVNAWRTAYEPTGTAVAHRPVRAIAVKFFSDFVISLVLALIAAVLVMVIVWGELNLGGGPRPALR